MALGTHYNLPISHLDIPNAFPQTPLDSDVFIKFPQGISLKQWLVDTISTGNIKAEIGIKLDKALYGLK